MEPPAGAAPPARAGGSCWSSLLLRGRPRRRGGVGGSRGSVGSSGRRGLPRARAPARSSWRSPRAEPARDRRDPGRGRRRARARRPSRDAAADEPRARSVQPGFYQLQQQMSAAGALALLLDPALGAARTGGRARGHPGRAGARDHRSRATDLTADDLLAAAKDTAALGLPAYAEGHLEGYLFPATYTVDPSTTAAVAARPDGRPVRAGGRRRLRPGGARRGAGRQPHRRVKVASMIEKEAAVDGDFGKVARVAYNRLEIGMKLQFDSTLNYALEVRKGDLSLEDIKIETPYNSYLTTGLPPTAISNPGTQGARGRAEPDPGRLDLLRHRRQGRQRVLHQGLRRVPQGQGRGQAGPRVVTAPRCAGSRCWARRSGTRSPRCCTGPPSPRTAWTGSYDALECDRGRRCPRCWTPSTRPGARSR